MADTDLLQDALVQAQQKRDSLLSFVDAAVGQRIKFHQDITGLSIILLGGIVALFNVSDDNFIKTRWLLYSAGGFLIITVFICIFVRVRLLQHLQGVLAVAETRTSNVYRAVRDLRNLTVRKDPPVSEGERAVAINKLIEAENPIDNFPLLDKVSEHGHRWTALIFIFALLQIALALLVHIS